MVVSWIRRLPERSVSPNIRKLASGRGRRYRVSPSRAQAGVFCPFLKSSPEERAALVEIAQRFPRRGGRVLGVHGAPAASKALQARQASWQRSRRLPLDCRTHLGLAASLPPPRAALRTPRGRPRSLPHARLRPHHLALPKEGVLKRTLKVVWI